MKRSTPTARRVSSDGSDQLPTTGRVSNGRRAYHSNRRTWTEDEGPASTPSSLPALVAKDQRQTPHCQHSLVGDRGREYHPPVGPVQQGSRTQGFYGRKPWKKPNSTLIIASPRPAKEGLRHPFRKPPPNRSLKLPAKPPHSRPSYRHKSRRVSLFRSSRFLIALRVSKNAV